MSGLPNSDSVSFEDLEIPEIERIFVLADQFAESLRGGIFSTLAQGLIMATLFYEPSTRTRLSFETAMHRLGGAVIGFPDMNVSSSAAKGETLADTSRVVSEYADVIVIRHPWNGSARVVADKGIIPVINVGD